MGERTILHGFFVGMQAPLPNSWNWFGQSISYLVLAVVVGKMLGAQAFEQSDCLDPKLRTLKLSIVCDVLCGEPACSDRLRFKRFYVANVWRRCKRIANN